MLRTLIVIYSNLFYVLVYKSGVLTDQRIVQENFLQQHAIFPLYFFF